MSRTDWTIGGIPGTYDINIIKFVDPPQSLKTQGTSYLKTVISNYTVPYGIVFYILKENHTTVNNFGRDTGGGVAEFGMDQIGGAARVTWRSAPLTPSIALDPAKFTDLGVQGQWYWVWVSVWNSGPDLVARVRQYDFTLHDWEIRGTFPVWAGAAVATPFSIINQPIGKWIDVFQILQESP